MNRGKTGFTLVELLITILMSGLVITAASSVFVGQLKQSRTQGGIVESNINLIGIDIVKRDIEGAGTGLTWDNPVPVAYSESGANLFTNLVMVNDSPNGTPRAIVSVNAATYNPPNDMFNQSDYLVIKSASVAGNNTCVRWSYVKNNNAVWQWTTANASENFLNNDQVIVLDPRTKTSRPLINNGGAFYTTYNAGALTNSNFVPVDANDTYLIYGIGTNIPVRPFNRADYFIARPANIADMPSRCAPNTGILYKAVMNHNAAGTLDLQPIVDCVADMQVIYGLDNDNDGYFQNGVGTPADGPSNDISAMTANDIRTRVKEIRVYILSHEGGRDMNYTYRSNTITVGEFGLGRNVALGANLNYRWKVYQMIVKPFNFLN